jgi:hypothetical protein
MLNGGEGECSWVKAAASKRRTCKHDVKSLFGALGSGSGSGRRDLLVHASLRKYWVKITLRINVAATVASLLIDWFWFTFKSRMAI